MNMNMNRERENEKEKKKEHNKYESYTLNDRAPPIFSFLTLFIHNKFTCMAYTISSARSNTSRISLFFFCSLQINDVQKTEQENSNTDIISNWTRCNMYKLKATEQEICIHCEWTQQMNENMNEWLNESMSKYMNEWVNFNRTEKIKTTQHIWRVLGRVDGSFLSRSYFFFFFRREKTQQQHTIVQMLTNWIAYVNDISSTFMTECWTTTERMCVQKRKPR